MSIFYEKVVPKTATNLTVKQFNYLKWLVGAESPTTVSGYIDELDDKSIPFLISKIRKTENYVVNKDNFAEWLERNDFEKYEISDSELSELIKTYGGLTHEISVRGETRVERTHHGYIPLSISQMETLKEDEDIDLDEFTSDDILEVLQMEISDEEIDYDDEYVDDESWEVENLITKVSMYGLITPEIFAEPTLEKKVA